MLSITMVILIGILGYNLIGNTRAYLLLRDKSDDDVEYDQWGEPLDSDVTEANDILDDTCMYSLLAGVVITILALISFTLLFGARYNYGKKHSFKMIAALILVILTPIVMGMDEYYYEMMTLSEVRNGVLPAISILLFIAALYLSISEIGGKRFGFMGLLVGTLATVPLFPVKYDLYDFSFTDLDVISRNGMIADIGLIIAMILFLIAIKKALSYTQQLSMPRKNAGDEK